MEGDCLVLLSSIPRCAILFAEGREGRARGAVVGLVGGVRRPKSTSRTTEGVRGCVVGGACTKSTASATASEETSTCRRSKSARLVLGTTEETTTGVAGAKGRCTGGIVAGRSKATKRGACVATTTKETAACGGATEGFRAKGIIVVGGRAEAA